MIEVSGRFRAYGNQWSALDKDDRFMLYDFSDNPQQFKLVGRSALDDSLVMIEVLNWVLYTAYRYWIDLDDQDTKFRILGSDLESVPIKYGLQSIEVVSDLNIELSDRVWADRTPRKLGVLTRDFNPIGATDAFQLQVPVIGPDVRVELVVPDHGTLGNYVVISFPASVYQENDMIMHHLAMQRWAAERWAEQGSETEDLEMKRSMKRLAKLGAHNPDEWHEDGRIFYAFAHLSEIEPHIQPGEFMDSPDKAIIGMTGNTGTGINHLDMDKQLNALEYLRTAQSADYFFGLAQRTQLPLEPSSEESSSASDLYGENLDPVRIHPTLDDQRNAEFMEGYSIYVE